MNTQYIILFMVLLGVLLILESLPPRRKFDDGVRHVEQIITQMGISKAIMHTCTRLDVARTLSMLDAFYEGMEYAVEKRIYSECGKLNLTEGGDWYYCKDSFIFKDYLTSSEKSL